MKKWVLVLLVFLYACELQEEKVEPTSNDDFLIIAHRGSSALAPEHTMLAYEIAQQADATYIEIDLQMTKDGVLIAMHDEKVDRTTDGTGFVLSYTLEELKLLNAGKWFNIAYPDLANTEFDNLPVPSLEDIFSYFGDKVNYYIEMKSPKIYDGMEETLISLLHKYNLDQVKGKFPKVIIESFDEDSLAKVHKLEPKLPLIQLLSFREEAALSSEDYYRLNTFASGIGVNINAVNKDFIQEVQQNGLQVHLYSINNELDMKKALNLKANGIFTNNPDAMVKLLSQLN